MPRKAVGMLLKCTWGNICRVYRGMLSYEQVVSIIDVQRKYIRCYPHPACFRNNCLRVAGFTEIFCNRGVVNKGKGDWYSRRDNITKSAEAGRLLPPRCASPLLCRLSVPFACYHPRCAPTDSGARCRLSGRVLYAPRLQFVASLPALVLLVARRQRGGLPRQKVGKSGVDDQITKRTYPAQGSNGDVA